jgi:hypothetical protein
MLNLKKNACNLNPLESKSGGTTTPFFVFFATQNVVLIKWGKKDLIVTSSHTTYYRYIMPRAHIKSTSNYLQANSR